MTTAQAETEHAVELFRRVDEIEDVAKGVDKDHATRLLKVARETLTASEPVRVVAAARILGVSERTVRSWVSEGLLRPVVTEPRLLLDPASVHDVAGIVGELRAAGRERGLLDEIYRRLADATWLERDDLVESLAQMRRREGTVRVPENR